MVGGGWGPRRSRGALVVLLALLAFPLVVLAAPAAAQFPPQGPPPVTNGLFYASPGFPGGSFEPGLFVDPNGPCPTCRPDRALSNLEEPIFAAHQVAVAPDGTKLALIDNTGGGALRIFGLDGAHLSTTFTSLDGGLSWAPDSSFVVVSGAGLRRVAPDGSVGVLVPDASATDPFVAPDGSILYSTEAEFRRHVPGAGPDALVRPFPVASDLLAPDGRTFVHVAPDGSLVVETTDASVPPRVIQPLPGFEPFAYNGDVVGVRHENSTDETLWSIMSATDGLLREPRGAPGVPFAPTFSPDGKRFATLVSDPARPFDGGTLAVRSLTGDGSAFDVPFPGPPFTDLDWGPVDGPLRADPGDPFVPAPFGAGEQRIAFIVDGFADERGIFSARPGGSDLRAAHLTPDGFPSDLGPGPGPGQLGFLMGGDLFTVAWTGGEPAPVLTGRAIDAFSFAPSGRQLAAEIDDEFFGTILFERTGAGWTEVREIPDATRPRFVDDRHFLFEHAGATWLGDIRTENDTISFDRPVEVLDRTAPAGFFEEADILHRSFFANHPPSGNSIGQRQIFDREGVLDFTPLASGPPGLIAESTEGPTFGDVFLVPMDGAPPQLLSGIGPAHDEIVFTPDGRAYVVVYDLGGFGSARPEGVPADADSAIIHYPLHGGAPTVWPHTFDVEGLLPFVVPAQTGTHDVLQPGLEEMLITPELLLAAETAPAIVIGDAGGSTVEGTVLYRSRYGRGSTILVRAGDGNIVPVPSFGDAVVWDTTRSDNGYYTVEATDENGNVLESSSYLVQNARSTPRRIGAAAAAGLVVTTGAAFAAGLSTAAKESALEGAESRFAGGAARGLIGFGTKGAAAAGGMIASGALLGLAGTYDAATNSPFDAAKFVALLPYIGTALTLFFVAEIAIERFYARHIGRETEFKLWIPGAASLAVSTAAFGTPFGVPGHVASRGPVDHPLDGRRGLATYMALIALLLPFVAIARWKFGVYEVGVATATMLAVNLSIPVAELPGALVWRWNKWVWGAMVVVAFGLYSAALLALGGPVLFLVAGAIGLAGLAALFVLRRPGIGV